MKEWKEVNTKGMNCNLGDGKEGTNTKLDALNPRADFSVT